MKIKDLVINEGIIRVPPNLVTRCSIEVQKFVATYIAMSLTDSEMVPHIDINGFIKVKDYGGEYDHTDGDSKILGVKIKYVSGMIKYASTRESKEFMMGAAIDPGQQLMKKTTLGAYAPKSKIVIVNLTKLIGKIKPNLDIVSYHGNQEKYDQLTFDDKLKMLDMFVTSEIEAPITAFLKELNSTIEHELAHYIQHEYLHGKHPSQFNVVNDTPQQDYWTSDDEYSPQIISAKEDFIAIIKSLRKHNPPKAYLDILIKYMVGITDIKALRQEVMRIDDLPDELKRFNPVSPIMNSRQFFLSTKEHDTKKWKKAVKYLHTEVSDTIQELT